MWGSEQESNWEPREGAHNQGMAQAPDSEGCAEDRAKRRTGLV